MSQNPERARLSDRLNVAGMREVLTAHGYSEPFTAAPAPSPLLGPWRTGRTQQFNMKASPDTVQRFAAICRAYNWPSGLTLQHAVLALEEKLAQVRLTKGRDLEP